MCSNTELVTLNPKVLNNYIQCSYTDNKKILHKERLGLSHSLEALQAKDDLFSEDLQTGLKGACWTAFELVLYGLHMEDLEFLGNSIIFGAFWSTIHTVYIRP